MGARQGRWRRFLESDYGVTTAAVGLAVVVLVGVVPLAPVDAGLVVSQLLLWSVMLLLYSVLTVVRFRGTDAQGWADVADRQTRPPHVPAWWWWSVGRGTVQGSSYVGVAATVGIATGALVLPNAAALSPDEPLLLVGLAVATVVASWVSVHVAFAVHYATAWHHRGTGEPGLDFPGTPHPRLTDFLYLAFAVGMTAGTTDVTVTSTAMRRRVMGHMALSFLYNSVVVALVLAVVVGSS